MEKQRRLATYRMLAEAKQQKMKALEGITGLRPQPGTLEELRTKVRAILTTLAAQGTSHMAVAHRNLDASTEQDLRTLLADLERLQRIADQSQSGNP